MTLSPENRVLLTDLLRPPGGYRIDQCVATTYSLDLTALLLAPLTFALFDKGTLEDLNRIDPVQVLEATRRYSARTTVFHQAGAVAVPAAYRSVFTFLEKSVYAVSAPKPGRIFHPKIWALRFTDGQGAFHHRFVCASRNLTFDRSWDTVLCLDQVLDGGQSEEIEAEPLAQFLSGLADLAVDLTDERANTLRHLAASFDSVRLAPPPGYAGGVLLPIGLGQQPWPFAAAYDRLLAISPFLERSTLDRLSAVSSCRSLLSRPEAFDAIGAQHLAGWESLTFQQPAELDYIDQVAAARDESDGWLPPQQGLHAKTTIGDVGDQSHVVTGSANLTAAAWTGNVEFDVLLIGPRTTCGVAATLDSTVDNPGLMRLLETYTPRPPDPAAERRLDLARTLEHFHAMLAQTPVDLHVTRIDQQRARLDLSLAVPADPPGETLVWPVSVRQPRMLDGRQITWQPIALSNVTPFLAIETTICDDGITEARRCVIAVALSGDTDGREEAALRDVLRSAEDLVRYLVFLLGDPAYDAIVEATGAGGWMDREGLGASGWEDPSIALAEPLIKAVGRDDDAIARVQELLETLRNSDDGADLIPGELEELWAAVRAAHAVVSHE